MEEKITVEQVLEITARQLGEITIPVSLVENIGVPINRAIVNINACLEAMKNHKKECEEGNGSDFKAE